MSEAKIPRIAILGRPNVGKSTLFNILTRTRKAVVKNEPGVTRDVQIEPTEWWGHEFDVIDTGGITEATDTFSQLIKSNITDVLASADLVIVVMDSKSGLVPEDHDIIKIAKQSGKPIFLVVNKVDQMHKAEIHTSEFYEFGIDLTACSFERREGVEKIIEWIIENLPQKTESTKRQGVRLAIIGKPNAGKSSLCNFLLKSNRMLVSDIAGTTVDAIEAELDYNGYTYIITDTAGLRRSSKRKDGVEKLSSFKSYDAIDKSDIVLLLVDGIEGASVQEAKMVEYILSKHKPVILVSNKLDIAKEKIPEFRKSFRENTTNVFHFFEDIPIAFISAKTGSGVDSLFEQIEDLWSKLTINIKTSKLNDFFFESIRMAPAPVFGTKNVKFYYLTQTQQVPPSFIAFANHPEGVTTGYRRFLIKKLKERFDLWGVPIRIFVMKRQKTKRKFNSADQGEPQDELVVEDNAWLNTYILGAEQDEQLDQND